MREYIWLSYIRTGRTRVKARSGMREIWLRRGKEAEKWRNIVEVGRAHNVILSLQKAAAERSRAFDPLFSSTEGEKERSKGRERMKERERPHYSLHQFTPVCFSIVSPIATLSHHPSALWFTKSQRYLVNLSLRTFAGENPIFKISKRRKSTTKR